MKKISILAMAALFLAACNTTDEQSLVEEQSSSPLLFDAATNVPTTRATYGAINTNALMASADGFGVFAFHNYTDNAPDSKPANFMFNQQVRYTGSWTYSPVKYWPNETGTNAKSTDFESLSFLAYAPWISVEEAKNNKTAGNVGGIIGICTNPSDADAPANEMIFDNIAIDYEVAQNPLKQVDLLWGVGDGSQYTDVEGNPKTLADGEPLYELYKPSISYKVPFLFKHALSKLNLYIDAYVDGTGNTNPVANGTKIFVRKVTFKGNLATQGTLMLKNSEANKPEWKAIGGGNLTAPTDGLVLNDGRTDTKEATTEDATESFACLNPMIIQKKNAFGTSEVGVTNATVSLLKPAEDGTASLMVIPVKATNNSSTSPSTDPSTTTTTSGLEVTIEYDVLTEDDNLSVGLDDGSEQKGSAVTNIITKTIDGFTFEAGLEYTINMHLGMTSVKFDATVQKWGFGAAEAIGLPENSSILNDQTVEDVLNAAADYTYSPAYTYNGSFSFSGSQINYSINSTDIGEGGRAIMNDFARMLGGLYRQTSGTQITEIEYAGTTYVWDENGDNIGSNWTKEGTECTQATSLVTALVQSVGSAVTTPGSTSVTLKLNGTTVTCNVTVTEMP